jgi:outer membrane protein OmpA-like peptidoglycan-associated protein
MKNDTMKTTTMLAIAGAMAGFAMGCGHAAVSPQLSAARATMHEARGGAASRLEPDELLVAQRTLTEAEGQEDGTPREAHLAYVAERQTRIAMSDARRDQLESGIAEDQDDYQHELERVARERGVALDVTQRALTARDETVARQRDTIAARDVALTAEQEARRVADARATDAMARLRELANVRQEATETIITLSGEVLFATGHSVLLPAALDRLSPVVEAMQATDETAVISGYTDARGSDELNRRLSQSRAESVRDYLIGQGIPSARIRAQGLGETNPIGSNDTVEGRAYNRRVEISLHAVTPTAPIAAR